MVLDQAAKDAKAAERREKERVRKAKQRASKPKKAPMTQEQKLINKQLAAKKYREKVKRRKALGDRTNIPLGKNQNDNLMGTTKRNMSTAPQTMFSIPTNSFSLPPNHSCASEHCKLTHAAANYFLPMGIQPLNEKEMEKVLRVGEDSRKRKFPFSEMLSEEEEKKTQGLIAKIESSMRKRTEENEENKPFIRFKIENTSHFRSAFFIPEFSNESGFRRWNKRENKPIDSMISASGKNNMSEESGNKEPSGALFWMHYLSERYPETFKHVAEKKQHFQHIPRLNAYETVALLREISVTPKALFKISSHYIAHHGSPLCCTREELDAITKRMPELKFGEIKYRKEVKKNDRNDKEKDKDKTEEKEPEKIKYVHVDGVQTMELEMERIIKYIIDVKGAKYPTFGYGLEYDNDGKATKFGQYALVGTDHGGDYSQTGIRILLTSSRERRMTGCADSGTITIKLMMIKCKTDSAEILALTKKSVNDFIKAAEKSNLIAIKDGHNTIRCKLIPEEATDIECTGGITLRFKVDSKDDSIAIDPGLDTSTKIEHWKVMGPSKCKKLSDLCAVFTLDGRDGHSSTKCAICDLVQSEWKKKGRKGNPLTMAMLHEKALELLGVERINEKGEVEYDLNGEESVANTIGIKAFIMWMLCPTDTIPPGLHVPLGLVNDIRNAMIKMALVNIDGGGDEEKQKQIEVFHKEKLVQDSKKELEVVEEEITKRKEELSIVKKSLTKINATTQRHQALLMKWEENGDTKKVQTYTSSLKGLANEKVPHEESKAILTDVIGKANAKKEEIEKKISSHRALSRTLKARISALRKARKKNEGGADVELDNIFQARNITVKNYHGGNVVYTACRTLMDKCEDTLSAVNADWIERVRKRNEGQEEVEHEACRPFTEEEVNEKTLQFTDILLVLDALFGHIRIINPTRREVKRMKRCTKILAKLMVLLDLSETPKGHMALEHLIDAVLKLGGLGDKVEEWLEKLHQLMKKMLYLTQRMTSGWESQMTTIYKYMWRDTDPFVMHAANEANKKRRRSKRKSATTVKVEGMERRKDSRWDKILSLQERYLTAEEILEDESSEGDDVHLCSDSGTVQPNYFNSLYMDHDDDAQGEDMQDDEDEESLFEVEEIHLASLSMNNI